MCHRRYMCINVKGGRTHFSYVFAHACLYCQPMMSLPFIIAPDTSSIAFRTNLNSIGKISVGDRTLPLVVSLFY